MKKRILAFLLSITTAFSAVALGGCEFSLPFGSGSGSYEDGDTNTDGDTNIDTDGSGGGSGDSSSSGSGDSSSSGSGGNGDTDGCAEHTDENNDGACDECKNSVMRNIDIFAINDLHGKVLDGNGHIGVDELTSYFKQAKAQNPNTLFLSSGDMWQGAAGSNVTKGMLVTDWMNEVGFVSMTLGNHEYDWGEEYIKANEEGAKFPFLALNIYDNATNKRVEYCDASVMYETNGAKIGIIGAMGDCYSSISKDKVQGVNFKTGSALTALVKAEADKLRAQGADLIVYSVHDDFAQYDTALSNGYVDIVFEGHSHSSYAKKDSGGIWHLQGGGDNKGISRAQISVNIANETNSVISAKTVNTSAYSSYTKDPIINGLADKYATVLEEVNQVVGYTDSYRSSTAICNKVADLYLELGEKTWGSQYDIVLGGAFLSPRFPYNLQKGKVTYGDLWDIMTFDNQIVLCSLSGQKLLDQFINTSESRYYITLAGGISSSSINASKTYYIVTDTYTSLYSYNGCTEIARYDQNTFARDLLADYIGTGAWGVDPNPTPTPTPTPNPDGGSGDNSDLDDGREYTSIAELLEIGETLGNDAETADYYYVKGKITSIENNTYGNMYITDNSGASLYIYGLYDLESNRYDNMPVKPAVGDTIVVYDKLYNYRGTTLEFKNATLVEIVGKTDGSGSGNITAGDPYTNISKTEFYMDYAPATSWEDAYYRSLHGLMSGELTVPDQAPTISQYQPKQNGMFVKNTEFLYEDNGKTYIVVDAVGNEAFRVYKDGAYITLEEVAAYVYAFGTFPANYTESKDTEPEDSVWGKYLRVNHTYFSGDTSKYPYEPKLPNIKGCGGNLSYYEMDIGTTGTDCDPSYSSKLYNNGSTITRGAARIVYGKNDLDGDGVYEAGEIHLFYTYNHYNDFQEYLNYEGGWGEMFGNITGGGTISSKNDYNPTDYEPVYWGKLYTQTII